MARCVGLRLHAKDTDELLHKTGVRQMVKLLIAEDPMMAEIWRTRQDDFLAIFYECYDQEVEWIKYLFQFGAMVGINFEIANEYLEFVLDDALHILGFARRFNRLKDPLVWMRNWLTSDTIQVAPQETELANYQVGQVANNVEEEEFDDYDL